MATLAVKPTTLDLPQAFGHIRSSSDSNLLEKSHRFPNKDYEESPEEYYGDRPETEGFSIDPDKSERYIYALESSCVDPNHQGQYS